MRVTLTTSDGQHLTYSSGEGFASHGEMPCLRCGVCCTKWQPPLDLKEARDIARALGLSFPSFKSRYLQTYPFKRHSYLVRREEDACTFLRFENGLACCSIHEHKPEDCRRWKPNLEKRECQEGLRKRGRSGELLALGDLPLSPEELGSFYRSLIGDITEDTI